MMYAAQHLILSIANYFLYIRDKNGVGVMFYVLFLRFLYKKTFTGC